MSVTASNWPGLQRAVGSLSIGWDHLGDQMRFYAATIAGIPEAVVRYRTELLRLIAQMGLGTGALAMLGGTVAVAAAMLFVVGELIAVQGYNQLNTIGLGAWTGLIGVFFDIRLIAPGVATGVLSSTIGASSTAELGAMRINEEIDALEVIGIHSIPYLCSTRVIAAVSLVIPLYSLGMLATFISGRWGTTSVYGQGSGVYDHYFGTFLRTSDVAFSFFEVFCLTVVMMLIHTAYGYKASGGPAGVGEATGRAVRASIVTAGVFTVMMLLALYGATGGNFRIAA